MRNQSNWLEAEYWPNPRPKVDWITQMWVNRGVYDIRFTIPAWSPPRGEITFNF